MLLSIRKITTVLALALLSSPSQVQAETQTRQAVQPGFLPRLTVVQTSADAHGQIYLPTVN